MFTDQCNEKQAVSHCFKDNVFDGNTTITSYVLRDGKKFQTQKSNQPSTKKTRQPTKPNPNIKIILTAWPCINPYLKTAFDH